MNKYSECYLLIKYRKVVKQEPVKNVRLIFSDLCDNLPCLNNGTCWSIGEGFICECSFGYSGLNCEKSKFHLENKTLIYIFSTNFTLSIFYLTFLCLEDFY